MTAGSAWARANIGISANPRQRRIDSNAVPAVFGGRALVSLTAPWSEVNKARDADGDGTHSGGRITIAPPHFALFDTCIVKCDIDSPGLSHVLEPRDLASSFARVTAQDLR